MSSNVTAGVAVDSDQYKAGHADGAAIAHGELDENQAKATLARQETQDAKSAYWHGLVDGHTSVVEDKRRLFAEQNVPAVSLTLTMAEESLVADLLNKEHKRLCSLNQGGTYDPELAVVEFLLGKLHIAAVHPALNTRNHTMIERYGRLAAKLNEYETVTTVVNGDAEPTEAERARLHRQAASLAMTIVDIIDATDLHHIIEHIAAGTPEVANDSRQWTDWSLYRAHSWRRSTLDGTRTIRVLNRGAQIRERGRSTTRFWLICVEVTDNGGSSVTFRTEILEDVDLDQAQQTAMDFDATLA